MSRLLTGLWLAAAVVLVVLAVFVVRAHWLAGGWCESQDLAQLERQHGAFTGGLVTSADVSYWPLEMRCRISDGSGRTIEIRRSAFT
jgi:hypothetical protein